MKESRKKVLDNINKIENQPIMDQSLQYDADIDVYGYKDILDQTIERSDEDMLITSDFDLTPVQRKELRKKRKGINDIMPIEYKEKDLTLLLKRQDVLVTDLKKEKRGDIYDHGSLEDVQAELEEIDLVLDMYAQGQTLDEDEIFGYDKEEMQDVVKKLRFKKSRDLSQILINDHTKSDSPEMQAIKYEVLRLSYRLEEIKDVVVTRDLINDICADYAVAIKFCEDYLSTKKKNSRYDKVYDVWQSLSYEKDSLALIRDQDFNEKENFTMGELLGMSMSRPEDIKRKNPLKTEKQSKNVTLSEETRNAQAIFDEGYSFEQAYDGVSKLSAKKKIAKQNYELFQGIKKFIRNQVQIQEVMIKGKKVTLLQNGEGDLFVLDKHQRIPLGKSTATIYNELANDMLKSPYYEPEHLKDLMVEYQYKTELSSGEYTNMRDNVADYLARRLGLKKDEFNNTRRIAMIKYARALIDGTKTEDQIKAEMEASTKSEDLINGIELTELMELDEARGGEISDHVSMYQIQAENDMKDWTEDEKAVKNLMAEFIFTSDTLIMDKNADDPKEFVRSVLMSNVKALKTLVDRKEGDEDIIASIMKKMSLNEIAGDDNADFTGTIASALKSFVEYLREKKPADIADALRKQNDEELNAKLREVHASMEESIKAASKIMQTNVNKIVGTMFDKVEEDKNEDPLTKIMKNATKSEAGQGLFVRNVLSSYFSKMNTLDQRAMLASVMRSCQKVDVKRYSDRALLEEIKDRKLIKYKSLFDKTLLSLTDEDKVLIEEYRQQKKALQIGANYFAGLIRGAGPLFHKMLQGLPEDNLPPEIRLALRDVKSKLPPIPERVVKTQMNAMIERSNGKITKIEVLQNLGAASVGQTFRCRIYGPDIPKDGKNVVVKLLRPDCQNRMKREEKVMLDCAKDASQGMYETYKGQLGNYYMELDLTQEAKNIKAGAIYNGKYADVCSESASKDSEPTINSLMIEEAPGKTLDDILLNSAKKRQEIRESVNEKHVNEDGEVEVLSIIEYTHENIKKSTEARKELVAMANDLIKKRDIMANITRVWIEEALFGTGYYHADLHAGNILLGEKMGTLIDFGNAVKFTEDQRKSITKMMTAAAGSNTDMFFEEFNKLLDMNDEAFKKFYDDAKKQEVKAAFEEILHMGGDERAGDRISAALIRASELGVKLPPAIFNFSQGQLRLQKSIDDINKEVQELGEAIKKIDEDFRDRINMALGLNVIIEKAYKDSKFGNFGVSVKQQIDSLTGFAEDDFVNALIDKTYVKGDKKKGIATIDKRNDFDTKYLDEVANFKHKLSIKKRVGEDLTVYVLQDFSQPRKFWTEHKAKWTKKFKEIEDDPKLDADQKKAKYDEAKKAQADESRDNIMKLFPENMERPIFNTLGIASSLMTVYTAIETMDDEVMENLFDIYEKVIPLGLSLEEKVNEFRQLQDEGKLDKDQEKAKAKEIYKLYSDYNRTKNKQNPVTSYFLTELQKVNSFESKKKDMKMMLEEPTLKKIEKENGSVVEIPLGKLFEQKLDEYYKIAKKYAPANEMVWNMSNLEGEDKVAVTKLRKELADLHFEITMIQANLFYKGRYDDEVSIKSFDFTDVMKDIIKGNLASFTKNVGVFNIIKMGGMEILRALKG